MPLLGSDLCMSTNLELPICSCCHRHIMPNDKCVKFKCPNCDNGDLSGDAKAVECLYETIHVRLVIFKVLKNWHNYY